MDIVRNVITWLPLVFLIFLLIIYWIGGFIILYHLIRFGVGTRPKIASFVFFIGSILLIVIAIALYARIDLAKFVTDVLGTPSPTP